MSSPTITAIDVLLISLGIAPIKYLVGWWMKHRAKKREKAIQKAIEEAMKKKIEDARTKALLAAPENPERY